MTTMGSQYNKSYLRLW